MAIKEKRRIDGSSPAPDKAISVVKVYDMDETTSWTVDIAVSPNEDVSIKATKTDSGYKLSLAITNAIDETRVIDFGNIDSSNLKGDGLLENTLYFLIFKEEGDTDEDIQAFIDNGFQKPEPAPSEEPSTTEDKKPFPLAPLPVLLRKLWFGEGNMGDTDSKSDGVPIGAIIPFATDKLPEGYLLCDGSAVSRHTYAALFDAIGTTFGAGDNDTTFNLPSLIEESYVESRYVAIKAYEPTGKNKAKDLIPSNGIVEGDLAVKGKLSAGTILGCLNVVSYDPDTKTLELTSR